MAILHDHIEGKYEILGKIREGGMGAIYKVRHRLLDEIRVVKILNPRLTVTPELSDRFLREARFAVQLRHPNIAQLHDFSVAEDGSAFIVMEFIDGATLEDILAQTGPPPLGLGLEMARQTIKALGFLHRRGLIHRDVSPDNLMLTRDPEGEPLVKLIDVGIAKVLKGAGALTSTGMFLGKLRYTSPEQLGAAGSLGVDARADLYSFGVVLYELLTGIYPIQGRDPSSVMAGHLFRPPIDFAVSDPRGRLPPDLREVLLRLLAKSPDERFADAEELAHTLPAIQTRFSVQPGDLDAALSSTRGPATPKSPSAGTTQDKLDRQFVQAPTPAVPARPMAVSTLVLRPRTPADDGNELAVMLQERQPSPESPPPAQSTAFQAPVPRENVLPARPQKRPHRRLLLPVAAILLFTLALTGFGLWRWSGTPFVSSARKETGETAPLLTEASQQPEAAADTSDQRPPDQGPVAIEPAQTVSPAAEPTPSAIEPLPLIEEERPERTPPASSAAPPPVRPKKESPKPKKETAPSNSTEAPSATPAVTSAPDSSATAKDVPARLLSVPSPVFPEAAKGSGAYARVFVAVRIEETGAVSETRIRTAYVMDDASSVQPGPSSSLLSAFHAAAREAAHKARFEPAQEDGIPTATWGELSFEFGKRPPS